MFGYRLIAETDKLRDFQRLDESSLSMTSQPFVRFLFDHTGLFIASITSVGLLRSRECGMRPEALPIYSPLTRRHYAS